jgi:putative transposase
MSRENPLWGAPRIHGELLKLGIDVGETSVGKYLVRGRRPPSQTWRTFLENHVKTLVSIDFFTVPTIRFQILYGASSRPAPDSALRGHCASDGGVDRPATP